MGGCYRYRHTACGHLKGEARVVTDVVGALRRLCSGTVLEMTCWCLVRWTQSACCCVLRGTSTAEPCLTVRARPPALVGQD